VGAAPRFYNAEQVHNVEQPFPTLTLPTQRLTYPT